MPRIFFCIVKITLMLSVSIGFKPHSDAAVNSQLEETHESATLFNSASWIWGQAQDSITQFRRVFPLSDVPQKATVQITADNGYELFINGTGVGSDTGSGANVWKTVERYDITARLAKGLNVIGIRGTDRGGVRGVVAAIHVEFENESVSTWVTDETWRATSKGIPPDYSHPEYVEGDDWVDATVLGHMGMAPWGQLNTADQEEPRHTSPSLAELMPPPLGFQWPETVAFIGDDCSVYVPLRGDAWGVCFRVGDWSRAYTEFDLPSPSKIGRTLHLLNPGPKATSRVILDAGSGAIGSPSATFDGRSLLVAMAPDGGSFFHIYRVPVSGAPPVQLTEGPFHDIDPAELPDGRIVFTSTRIGTFEEYHQPPSRALFRMNADGSNIHPITSTLIFDNEPKVMADGRIIFIRTDNFFDRGKVETHLHSIRPDGTNGLTEFGANVGPDYGVRLRAFGYGSPAPMPDGRLAFISSRGNFIGMSGTAEEEHHRLPAHLGDMAPLPDGRLLCTALRPSVMGVTSDVLGVIDPVDNHIVSIFQSPKGNIHSPVFVGERPRPPVIPDFVDPVDTQHPEATGFLFCQNARFTTKTKAGWEHIRAIRVLGAVPLTLRSSHSHIVHVGHETVELGTVPIAADGSFNIEVPADMPLALQAIDAEGRSELNEMSWMYVRPGERRSCIGCHQPREAAPSMASHPADALRAPAIKTLGQGNPHRFRGNNPGVTGMMDLQFERFRECASLNRSTLRDQPTASRRLEIDNLIQNLQGLNSDLILSSAQRLALLRTHEAALPLTKPLLKGNHEVRLASAIALASCGTRASIPSLLNALDDANPIVAQGAAMALENLTGHQEASKPSSRWKTWIQSNSWASIEAALIQTLHKTNAPSLRRRAVVALGHIGADPARVALRDFVRTQAQSNPYPPFVNDNRTDRFTFTAHSPMNPRMLQEAVRSLGQLDDNEALPLLHEILSANIDPTHGNLFLAEAVIEAIGRLGTPDAEAVLLSTFASLNDYWHYVGWYSDHPALYACHSSPIHARIIEWLDAIGSSKSGPIVPQLIGSTPTDPDRALFFPNDDYETLVGRLMRRSTRRKDVIESCLSLLGDPQAKPAKDLTDALRNTHPAWAGHPGPDNRAAQILSLSCRDPSMSPRIRNAFERYLNMPEESIERPLGNPTWTPIRHWTLFYLARTLGNLADQNSLGMLTRVLGDKLNEARHGRPDPSEPDIHLLQMEYTPCWRAAAAWALGEIGDHQAWPPLFRALTNFDNSIDVRHAAAQALGKLVLPSDRLQLMPLASDYPDISIRKVLRLICKTIDSEEETRSKELSQNSR